MMLKVKQMENRKQLLTFDEPIKGKINLTWGVLGKTILSIHLIQHV